MFRETLAASKPTIRAGDGKERQPVGLFPVFSVRLDVAPETPEASNRRRLEAVRAQIVQHAGPMRQGVPQTDASQAAPHCGEFLRTAASLVGVRHKNSPMYPLFQFDDQGNRLEAVGRILAVLPPDGTGWSTLYWFIEPNRCLDWKAPKDVLGDPQYGERLLHAARMATSEGDVY